MLNVLFLFFVFFLGLISTFFGFPTKKIVAWFYSLSITNHPACGSLPPPQPPSISKVEPRKKAAVVAATTTSPELRGVFATFDKNNDGYITKQELRESLNNIGIFASKDDVEDMVGRVDSNGDGLIDFDEFNELFTSMLMRKEEEEEEGKERDLKEAFQVFDGDGDGLISVQELGLVLSSLGFKEGKTLESCKEMINKVDVDGDGMVNFEEFKRMMKADGRLVLVS